MTCLFNSPQQMASNQRSAARDTGKQARRVFDMIETPAQLLDSDKGIGEKRAILGQVFGDHRLFGFQTAVRLWLPLRRT